jgi:NADH-quinone oxidoreductase subunit L
MGDVILKSALLIFLLPLAAFVLLGLFNRRIPRRGDFIATGVIGACLALSLYIFIKAWSSPEPLLVNITFSWLPMSTTFNLSGGVMVDRLTAVMLVVVNLVSFLVHLFSIKYMEGDVRYGRYYAGLLLFTTSMLGLVLANNLLYLYIFWELVGLSSYILIGHWFEKKSASDAAVKAFITTRLGDVGMFIGIMICYYQVGSLQYADLFAAVETGTLAGGWRTLAGLGIFFGAMGKSAQFPLHVWLPDAMEGPTPVSALIHAATMVAAGVYLTGRMLPMFDPTTLLFIAYIGGFTAIFAATIALVQDDIKKVLAYSTVSQLGYMILALGVGGYVSGLFHLTTHAFFKACLFLGALFYLLATLALAGFPGFSGFWSKDAILADALAFSMLHGHWFLPLAGFATVFLTAFYMFRQFFLTFTGKPRDQHAYEHAHEAPWQMLVPLIVLGSLAVVGGGFGGWFGGMNPSRSGIEQVRSFNASGYSSPFVSKALEHAAPETTHEAAYGEGHSPEAEARHQAHYMAMALSTVLGLSGIFLGALMYLQRKDGRTVFNPDAVATRFRPAYQLLWNKYYLDEIYMASFVMTTRAIGWGAAVFDRTVIDGIVNLVAFLGWAWSYIVEIFDRYVVDGLFVNGSARTTSYMGGRLSRTQTGLVRQYVILTVTGILVIAGLCAYALYKT